MDFEILLDLLRALEHHDVGYVLIGGVALSVHGIVRATEDIDLFVRPEPGNIERLRRALRSVWDDPEIEQITEQDLAGEYPTIRYVPPAGGPVIDLLARLGTEFRFEDVESELVAMGGIQARVATPGMLYRMKKSTVRLIDRADAEALRQKFGLEE
jgi:hypothetical protein